MNTGLPERVDALFGRGKAPESQWLDLLIAAGLDRLPNPGSGATLIRWQVWAAVGAFDLSLAKLFEGHTDALAILSELEPTYKPSHNGSWGVWAAEAPGGRTVLADGPDGTTVLHGAKHWCAGALTAEHALLTAWQEDGSGPHLVRGTKSAGRWAPRLSASMKSLPKRRPTCRCSSGKATRSAILRPWANGSRQRQKPGRYEHAASQHHEPPGHPGVFRRYV